MSEERYLSIAGVRLRVTSEHEIPSSEQFRAFFTSPGVCDYSVEFKSVDRIECSSDRLVFQNADYAVCECSPKTEKVYFFDRRRNGEIYAERISDYAASEIKVQYLRDRASYVSEWNNSFLHIGFETFMARRGRFILHSSFIRSPYGGILFSGVSGIGKSTQADLWCKHTDSELLNGDRAILTAADGIWTAWGSPYAGSSNCYRNESAPVRCIVMLRQSRENSIRALSPAESFKQLYRGMSVNLFDRQCADLTVNSALELSSAVPVLELSCTPDIHAVKTLMRELERS